MAVRAIVDYGCDYDVGRPLRISPAKLDAPVEEVIGTPAELRALAKVLPSWTR
ncbi:hypothetical protein [Actinomadura fibrosa]|uniref:Uncharacterized protein n=1 Tax=Actinomadura fibrosa TaxID=111802 RepID=A0ABW2XGS4_9ACTN|nr:hypothetical protein [Actinomadura fibrosa]